MRRGDCHETDRGMRRGQAPLRRLFTKDYAAFVASCPRLRTQRSFCRRATLPCDHDKAAGGPFFPKTTITQQAEPFNFAATALRRRNCNTLQRRKLESDAAPLRQILLQASYSTCRNDGTAVILEFKPRLENRCSKEVKTRAIRASILDFRPRLANRCNQKAKTRAIRASIPDFKPRLANRCSRVAHSWGQPHPPQAESAAETAQTPQAESAARTPSTTQKKESRLIAESGLSKRGSYLLSHLV